MPVVEAPSLTDLRSQRTVTITEAAAFLGMSTASGYRAAHDGTLPTIRVGRVLRVPVPALFSMLGLPYELPPTTAPVHQPAMADDGGGQGESG